MPRLFIGNQVQFATKYLMHRQKLLIDFCLQTFTHFAMKYFVFYKIKNFNIYQIDIAVQK